MIPFLDLTEQYKSLKPEIDEAVTRVFSKGQFILGEEVAQFEQELADYLGVKYVVGVASGTDALYLSLKALNVGVYDRVITTPFTFIATSEAIARCGAIPVFIDTDTQGNIDLSLVKRYMGSNNPGGSLQSDVVALLPVHLYGNPVDMDTLLQMAQEYGASVIEDACQAFGATWEGKKVGSIGDIGCFSFFPSKSLGCYGDGGAIVTNSELVAKRVRKLRDHGAYEPYMSDEHGVNSRLDELQATILRVKLRHIDEWLEIRRHKAEVYRSQLESVHQVALPLVSALAKHAWNYYTIQVGDRRNSLRRWLALKGIRTIVYYPMPLHLQKVYSYLGYKEWDCPIAEALSYSVLSLPMYPELPDESIVYICQAIKDWASSQ
jgi:dTDP-4-amino-4,6-dideoxygalactose transaminase